MSYLVTARKWRPQVFEDLVGQEHISTTLKNALGTNRLSHAYLFAGPRGVGKTTTARILAKAVNCLHPNNFNPDNECEVCKEITEGRNMDVLEIDGASNRGIEEIRNLRESVKYVPTKNKYKVYVIDEVHMLTKEAFNALLKTLEEPPPHIIFIFATTEVHKLPATILSRCQRFDFRRIGIEEIMNRLRFIADAEKIKIEDDALLLVAKKGDGSMRDSQSIFDQIVSFCGDDINAQKIIEALNLVDQEIFFRTTDLIKSKDANGGISLVEEIISRGYDIKEFLSGLNEHLRNFLITRTTNSTQLIETAEVYKKRYQSDAEHFSESDLLRLIKIVTETENGIKWSQQPRFKLEVALVQMIKMENSVQISELLTKIDELKKKLSSGIPVGGKVHASPPSMSSTQKFENKNDLLSSIASTNISYPFVRETTKPSYINTPYQQTKSVFQAPENQIIATTQHASLTFEEASVKWKDVVLQARQERVTLGSSLGLTQVIECSNGSLKIACPDNFNLDFFKRNRDQIHSLAEKVYGVKFRLEAILADINTSTSTSLKKSAEQQTETHHPVVEALKSKLGAVKIK